MRLKSWMIIAGVVGIASALTNILYFQRQLFGNISANEHFTTLTIEGLRDTYKVGEPIVMGKEGRYVVDVESITKDFAVVS